MAYSNYCVTFRIANRTIGGKTYDERRQQLIDNIYDKSGGYWEETTSFFFAGSQLDTPTFAAKACKGLSPENDLVVVFDPEDMSACYFGPVEHRDALLSFLPKAKKLG